MTTKTFKDIDKEKQAAVKKIAARIEKSGLQKNHICIKMEIAPGTLSYFLACKKDYVTASMIKRLNDYLDTVNS